MKRTIKPEEVAWTVRHLNMMALGGTWAVPRSGIIFRKTGHREITLVIVMPFEEGLMACTKEQLEAAQREEFNSIAARARAGKYTVKSSVPFIQSREEHSNN